VIRRRECPRTWQAAAIEDGRLEGPERASFRQHVAGCSVCAEEVKSLADLRQVMQLVPAMSSTPLEHRRLRAALLRRADAQIIHAADRHAWRRFPVWAVGVLVLAIAVSWGLVRARSRGDLRPGSSAPSFEIADLDHAEWTSAAEGATTRVRLAGGSASFHVAKTAPNQRFLLLLPDGELEVHGTRFLVTLADRGTQHVAVSEGIVSLRLRGAPELSLGAGDQWDRSSIQEPSSPGSAAASVESPHARGSAPRPAGDRGSVAAPDAFAAGVTAFRAGDFARAEQLLDRFLNQATGDPRQEDACFLRAVARSRSGDAEGAAKLAQEYLRRFPNGLRRPEAESLAAAR
jgi:FecR protein